MRKKINYIVMFLLIMVIVALVFYINLNSVKVANINENNDANIVVNEFIELLFNGDKKALDYSIGSVKKNINNNIGLAKKSNIVEIKNVTEFSNDNVAIINTSIEYEDETNANIIFYRLKLVKKDDAYLVYQMEETSPLFNSNADNVLEDENIYDNIEKYFNTVANNQLEEGVKYLVGKARTNHLLTYEYLKDLPEIVNVSLSDFKYNTLFINNEVSLIEVNYLNGENDSSVVITLCKTHQGWLIYDITQI